MIKGTSFTKMRMFEGDSHEVGLTLSGGKWCCGDWAGDLTTSTPPGWTSGPLSASETLGRLQNSQSVMEKKSFQNSIHYASKLENYERLDIEGISAWTCRTVISIDLSREMFVIFHA